MNEKQIKAVSKFLSFILRHNPQMIGLALDEQGWVEVNELLAKASGHHQISRELLDEVVTTNDKQRFTFNDDRTKIRASQGHSIVVDLNLEKQEPPEYLYHGTVSKFIDAIKDGGLKKMDRQHVHLSEDKKTAAQVGGRRGVPVILTISSGQMYQEGFAFYLSENQVWLTDNVPERFINFYNMT